MENGSPIAEVVDVSMAFGDPEGTNRLLVLEKISLAVRAGEVLAILGPSGSGKSTLLRIMIGLLQPKQRNGFGAWTAAGGNSSRRLACVPEFRPVSLAHR